MKSLIRRRGQRGAVVIEFALVLVFLLLLTVGITEIGRALWYYDALQKAVRDGARCLVNVDDLTVNPSASTAISECLNNIAVDANDAGVKPALTVSGNVDFSCTPDCTTPEYVTVAITKYSMPWIWSISSELPQPGGSASMSVNATMPYLR